ncbi:hypothetical protein ACT01_10555 [Megasphaera hexanoica]|nr:hypothetical protein ACT01_10555 [Megasphaera hexanoica]
MKVSGMSDDELRTLASKRFKNGRITKQALEAQRELWERHGRPFSADRRDLGDGDYFVDLDFYDGNTLD